MFGFIGLAFQMQRWYGRISRVFIYFFKFYCNEKRTKVLIFTYLTQGATIRHTKTLIHLRLSEITLFLTHSKGFWGFCCIWPFDQSKLVEWCGSCCFCLPLYPHFGGGVTWPDFSVLNIDPEKIWYKSCNLLVNINNLWHQHVYT